MSNGDSNHLGILFPPCSQCASSVAQSAHSMHCTPRGQQPTCCSRTINRGVQPVLCHSSAECFGTKLQSCKRANDCCLHRCSLIHYKVAPCACTMPCRGMGHTSSNCKKTVKMTETGELRHKERENCFTSEIIKIGKRRIQERS
jgi:hypothetical protein